MLKAKSMSGKMTEKKKMINCKCGTKPNEPATVKGLTGGFLIKCSGKQCPAKSQRIGKQSTIDAWNKLAEEA
jgi:hypothetical protein